MKEFQNEQDILEGVKKAEKVERRDKGKVCDWGDEREKSILKSERNAAERRRTLDIIIPSRVCPSCKRKIWMDSHWVVKDKLAWCRSCFRSQHKEVREEVLGSIINRIVIRVEFDGWRIKLLRHDAGVGTYAFSTRCGWSKAYQEQIERDSMKTLSLESITTIIQVFEDIGVTITDSI